MQDVHFHHFKSKLLRTTTKLRMNCRERTEIHFQPPLGQCHVYRISSPGGRGHPLKFRPKVVAGALIGGRAFNRGRRLLFSSTNSFLPEA